MPTERFYRLPEAKKQVIREAAIKEFARVPFEKASINQIIQNADISRGSFYTYFEDKQDVVRYIFEDAAKQMQQLCEKELERSGGDFFSLMEWIFSFMVGKLGEAKEMLDLAQNVFAYQENTKALGFEMELDLETHSAAFGETATAIHWMYDRIDRSGFRCEQPGEVESMMQMAMAALMLAIRSYYHHPDCREVVSQGLQNSLNVLKRGIYKE